MARYLRISVGLLVVLLATSRADAQERPWGLTISTDRSIALIWRVTDQVAVRPAIEFATVSRALEPPLPLGIDDIGDSTSVALQASVLLYAARWDDLRAYVAPGVRREWISTDTPLEQSGFGVEGMFGLEYALGERFAVFGETGLLYNHRTSESTLSTGSLDLTTNSVGTAARLGVIFSF